MQKYLKIIGYGVLTWLIPFVISFFFYGADGNSLIDKDLFKSIMIVIGALVGCWLLVKYFRQIKKDYINEGIKVGLIWFAVNILLDFPTLLMMFKMPIDGYIMQIAVRYLNIPIICIMAGALLEPKKSAVRSVKKGKKK